MSRCADREAGDLGAHGCGLGAGQADVGANVPEELAAAPLESVVAEVGGPLHKGRIVGRHANERDRVQRRRH